MKTLCIGEHDDGSIYEPMHRHFHHDDPFIKTTSVSTLGQDHVHYLYEGMSVTTKALGHIHKVFK